MKLMAFAMADSDQHPKNRKCFSAERRLINTNYSQYIVVSKYEKGVFEERIRAVKNFFAHGFAVEDVQKMYPDLNAELLAYLKSESDSSKSK